MTPDEARQVLGLAVGAEPAEARRAYLALARRFHPDVHASRPDAERRVAERRMRELNEAMAVLGREAGDEQVGATRDVQREPVVRDPAGPGWRPRPGDDGWMDDFRAWADESDDLLPEEDRAAGIPQALAMAPPLLLAGAILAGVLGAALGWRALVAVAVVALAASIALFAAAPLVASRRSGTAR